MHAVGCERVGGLSRWATHRPLQSNLASWLPRRHQKSSIAAHASCTHSGKTPAQHSTQCRHGLGFIRSCDLFSNDHFAGGWRLFQCVRFVRVCRRCWRGWLEAQGFDLSKQYSHPKTRHRHPREYSFRLNQALQRNPAAERGWNGQRKGYGTLCANVCRPCPAGPPARHGTKETQAHTRQ